MSVLNVISLPFVISCVYGPIHLFLEAFSLPSLFVCLLYAPNLLILSPLHCSPLTSSSFPLHIETLAILSAVAVFQQSPSCFSQCCLLFQRLSFLIGVSVHPLSSSACFFPFSTPLTHPNSHLAFSSHLFCIAGIRPPASCLPPSRLPVCFYVNASSSPPFLLLGVLF